VTPPEHPIAATEKALARISAVDGQIKAWVEIDRQGAIDRAEKAAAIDGPLRGVPVGIKDIFDVAGMPTRLGSGAFAAYEPDGDSVAVARLRQAGAVIIGKTTTTEFAYRRPTATRNPWNLEHTPGGSSSGSAAAVAAGMVPLALGSQTVGSTLRPAAYCGIVGLKPSHGRISASGVFRLASSFDHVGILCRSVEMAATALSVLAGYDAADPFSVDRPVDDYVAAAQGLPRPPRLAIARGDYRSTADEAVASHIDAVAGKLAAAGATVTAVELPASSQAINDFGYPMLRADVAAAHERLYAEHSAEYGPDIRELVESGQKVTGVEYANTRFGLLALRHAFETLLQQFDGLLTASAPTTAPEGLSFTGNAVFCAPASFMGLPAISLPSGLDPKGLPYGVQIAGAPFAEAHLLGVASWVEKVLDFKAEPLI
jgi:amidase